MIATTKSKPKQGNLSPRIRSNSGSCLPSHTSPHRPMRSGSRNLPNHQRRSSLSPEYPWTQKWSRNSQRTKISWPPSSPETPRRICSVATSNQTNHKASSFPCKIDRFLKCSVGKIIQGPLILGAADPLLDFGAAPAAVTAASHISDLADFGSGATGGTTATLQDSNVEVKLKTYCNCNNDKVVHGIIKYRYRLQSRAWAWTPSRTSCSSRSPRWRRTTPSRGLAVTKASFYSV